MIGKKGARLKIHRPGSRAFALERGIVRKKGNAQHHGSKVKQNWQDQAGHRFQFKY